MSTFEGFPSLTVIIMSLLLPSELHSHDVSACLITCAHIAFGQWWYSCGVFFLFCFGFGGAQQTHWLTGQRQIPSNRMCIFLSLPPRPLGINGHFLVAGSSFFACGATGMSFTDVSAPECDDKLFKSNVDLFLFPIQLWCRVFLAQVPKPS